MRINVAKIRMMEIFVS